MSLQRYIGFTLVAFLFLTATRASAADARALSSEELAALCDPANVLYASELVTINTENHMVPIEASLGKTPYISLLVYDGGNGYGCDHSDWIDARFTGSFGEKPLTTLEWMHNECGHNDTQKNKSVAGRPLTVNGRKYDNGIGTHSPGLIVYPVPDGATKFLAQGALDDSGTRQIKNSPSSVQFIVYAGIPPRKLLTRLRLGQVTDPAEYEKFKAILAQVSPEAATEYRLLDRELTKKPKVSGGAVDNATRLEQTFIRDSAILPEDVSPLGILLRRTRALYNDLKSTADIATYGQELDVLAKQAAAITPGQLDASLQLFEKTIALRRRIAFANPLLKNISQLLFITREALPPDEFNFGNHMCDQYFGFHATIHGTTKGNGLYVLDNPWSDKPVARNLIADSVIKAGARKGQKLGNGGFLAPDISFDGKEILFSYTDGKPEIRVWNEQTTFHIFKCSSDGSDLVQLTDGQVNDLDPCWLPNGRIAFISERRGGYGRCHGRPVPSFTLHSMFEDGTDITRLSPHETNEWQPSVDNNGMICYTRWDYIDRGFNQAHHAWTTYPDGRDSRPVNGNNHDSQRTAPMMQMDVRAVPGSRKYVAIATGHHCEARGSIILVDPGLPDDNAMSQIKRVTPDQLFPEAEYYFDRGSAAYASPWPLSEKYYICVYDGFANAQYGTIDTKARNYAITLMDAFGNRIPIYNNPEISCLSPMPLHPRKMPPVLPHRTLVGRPRLPNGEKPGVIPPESLPRLAKVGLINVYNSRFPMPEGVRIKALRIWQVLPKTTPNADHPKIGMGSQKGAKLVLGTVPVEEDGSAYWEQPVNVPILFHALDENGVAIQGMRSVTYTAPGETLMCNGCHESRVGTARTPPTATPLAMKRAASTIKPEMEGTNPFHYARLIQPVIDAKCLECHGADRKEKAPDLRRGPYEKDPNFWFTSFKNLKPYLFFYDNASWTDPYTIPGKFGANASKLYQKLKGGHGKLNEEELRRFAIWMDSNCLFHGHDADIRGQADGKVIQPPMM